MTQEPPERPGTARFLAALHVRRNAAIGLAFGLLVGVIFTHGTITGPQGTRPDIAYVMLGFVLTVGLGLLTAAVLTLVSAVRLAGEE